ncbi:MAG: acyl-CoA dehydrogenase family protein [Burkholderiales bacterium]|nr:acyl-CoA dehydrogenase family protein [Burkholderiales bacterium]
MGLDFALTAAQERLREAARAFIAAELTPGYLDELDASGRCPQELLPKLAAHGFTGLPVPAAYGGGGGGAGDVSVLLEEFGRASLGIASFLNRALGWGAEAIQRFGSVAQKQDFLPKVCSGEMIFAFSHTEPDAGSDAASIRTRAIADGDGYVIDGTKMFTTGAAECPCLIVTTRTDPQAARHAGISVFLVDARTPGIGFRKIDKLGMRGAGGLYEVRYEAVRVPRDAVLGEPNGGWRVITGTLERARLAQAAYCVGAAQQSIDDVVAHLRGAGGARAQARAHLLADLQLRTEAARLLLYRAAALVDDGVPCVREASIANLHATETLVAVTSEVLGLWGMHGVSGACAVERTLRDARLFIIGDGSSQIQRNLIARQMGL